MAFIDIFNFKKYFLTPSDSQVARYGHVNALYSDVKITAASYTASLADPDVNITKQAGVISITDDIVAGSSPNFNIINPTIVATSTVIVTVSVSNAVALNVYSIVESGSVNITIVNNALINAENVKINFLIIN